MRAVVRGRGQHRPARAPIVLHSAGRGLRGRGRVRRGHGEGRVAGGVAFEDFDGVVEQGIALWQNSRDGPEKRSNMLPTLEILLARIRELGPVQLTTREWLAPGVEDTDAVGAELPRTAEDIHRGCGPTAQL